MGSLCSGYGGLDLAVARVFGAETAWHAETDPDASVVLKANFDGLANHGDISTVDWRDVEPVDILAAGFPCQPVSVAGQRKAQADHRWLWPHVLRAAREFAPSYVVLENVQNLVSIQQGAVLAGILTDLMAVGYRSRWCITGTCAVGSCHHRHRLFLAAERGGRRDGCVPQRVDVLKCGAPRGKGRVLLPTPVARDGDHRGDGSPDYWQRRRDELGRVNGIPLGAAVRLLLTPRASDGVKGGPNQHGAKGDLMLPSAVIGGRFAEYAPAVLLWQEITGLPVPEPTEPNRNGAMRLAPAFAEWMMGLPRGWVTDHVDRVPALRIVGNGVVPLQAEAALRSLLA